MGLPVLGSCDSFIVHTCTYKAKTRTAVSPSYHGDGVRDHTTSCMVTCARGHQLQQSTWCSHTSCHMTLRWRACDHFITPPITQRKNNFLLYSCSYKCHSLVHGLRPTQCWSLAVLVWERVWGPVWNGKIHHVQWHIRTRGRQVGTEESSTFSKDLWSVDCNTQHQPKDCFSVIFVF